MPDLAPPALSQDEFQALFDRISNWGRWGPDDERGTGSAVHPIAVF